MTPIPITHPAASRHLFRQQLTKLITRLIDTLDQIDGDPDFEPSLGLSELQPYESQAHAAKLAPIGGPEGTDLEEACEDEGAQCDDEGAIEQDNDTSDYEASLCGITFGATGTTLDG
ncbi:hypothetical protein ACFPIF_02410 [Brevundimonas faecalis]|uniref:hypothetical protein n=1 Tax=Brevundimonas faecalis TaxID=947378 RepID=UPI0036222152